MNILRSTHLAVFLVTIVLSAAQADERVAYAPKAVQARAADDHRIGPGGGGMNTSSIFIPEGTHRIDLLNAKGNVKRAYNTDSLAELDLGNLKPGTWTLRAHTSSGISIRRFVVINSGTVIWSVPSGPHRK